MDDAELQQALNDALSVSPSPDFAARVRMKIAAAETSPMPVGWLLPAAVAVSIAAIAFVVVSRPGAIEPTSGVEVLGSRPIAALAQPPAMGAVPTLHSPSGANTARPIYSEWQEMPEVIIAPDNREGLLQLLNGVRERRFEATFDETPASTPWALSELTVAPLIIEPLEPPAANN